MKRLVPGLGILLCGGMVAAQPIDSTRVDPAGHFVVYAGDGEPADLEAIVSAMADVDVVFIGEQHNDPTAHALELLLLETARRAYSPSRRVVLGMEMFERDVQTVLDEYLAGYIREADFLNASRPWGNYETDYKPLIEFAKDNGMSVIASNAPARYTSMARQRGLASLDSLSEIARMVLPHEPGQGFIANTIQPPSSAYGEKFRAELEGMDAHGSMPGMPSADDLMIAQNLRDASMAYWIADQLDNSSPLVVHVNGSFHSAGGLGIPEHLARYASWARVLIITLRAADDLLKGPEPTDDDFIILTDNALLPAE